MECVGKTAVVKLCHGVTNAISPDLVSQLAEVVQNVKQDPGIDGLVLTGSNEKFFCIGLDIPRLYELDRDAFASFFRAFHHLCLDLYTLPKPTVAAVTGHATAGGCILAVCCDYRFIADGKKFMGFNEVKLGVPVPYRAVCMLRSLLGDRYAREMMESGDFYRPEELLQMGLVDRVLPVDQVVAAAVEKVAALGSMPRQGYAMIKQDRVESVVEQIARRFEEKDKYFVQCWFAGQTREKLKEAMEKF
jgi:enoyl-CoA hydratase/carnithine racemase